MKGEERKRKKDDRLHVFLKNDSVKKKKYSLGENMMSSVALRFVSWRQFWEEV